MTTETTSTETTNTEPVAPPAVVVGDVKDGRARFLRTKQPRFELATIDGAEVALVVPAEGVRGEIQQLALDVDKSGKVRPGNAARRRALTVIAMVHTVIVDPTTGQKRAGARIFSDADLPTLINEPSGPESVISQFAPKCEAVLDRIDAGAVESAKNG
jgi:hypothetical protein